MRTKNHGTKVLLVLSFLLTGFQTMTFAQTATAAAPPDPGITVYQYRRVAGDKRDEFVKRETTYWAEIAKKAIAKGNITFWALLEKQGGYDMENTSNFLFINTYKDIDKIADVWSTAAITASFPTVTVDKMETYSMSTVTSTFFLRAEDWQQAATAVAEKDFNYVSMVYHHATQPANLIDLEKKHWGPFIKSSMDKKQVSQVAWGNARVLSPSGPSIGVTTVSYDLYSTLKEALYPTWDPKVVLPQEGLTEIGKIETARGGAVYHIIKVVNSN
ncbi:MAG: hypothetical protein AABY93_11405 [Bacteroidota bacterium]